MNLKMCWRWILIRQEAKSRCVDSTQFTCNNISSLALSLFLCTLDCSCKVIIRNYTLPSFPFLLIIILFTHFCSVCHFAMALNYSNNNIFLALPHTHSVSERDEEKEEEEEEAREKENSRQQFHERKRNER